MDINELLSQVNIALDIVDTQDIEKSIVLKGYSILSKKLISNPIKYRITNSNGKVQYKALVYYYSTETLKYFSEININSIISDFIEQNLITIRYNLDILKLYDYIVFKHYIIFIYEDINLCRTLHLHHYIDTLIDTDRNNKILINIIFDVISIINSFQLYNIKYRCLNYKKIYYVSNRILFKQVNFIHFLYYHYNLCPKFRLNILELFPNCKRINNTTFKSDIQPKVKDSIHLNYSLFDDDNDDIMYQIGLILVQMLNNNININTLHFFTFNTFMSNLKFKNLNNSIISKLISLVRFNNFKHNYLYYLLYHTILKYKNSTDLYYIRKDTKKPCLYGPSIYGNTPSEIYNGQNYSKNRSNVNNEKIFSVSHCKKHVVHRFYKIPNFSLKLSCTKFDNSFNSNFDHSKFHHYLLYFRSLESFSISNCYLHDHGIESLCIDVFINLKHLKVLDISKNYFGQEGTHQLCNILRYLTGLQSLIIKFNHLTFSEFNLLFSAISYLPQLTKLDLRETLNGSSYDDEEINISLVNLSRLSELSLRNCFLSRHGVAILSSTFHHLINLTKLNIRSCPYIISNGQNIFIEALQRITNLTELNLRNCSFPVNLQNSLFKYLPKLIKLNLSNNNLNQNVKYLCESFVNLSNLQVLKLSHNHISSSCMEHTITIKYLIHLEILDLKFNDLDNDCLKYIELFTPFIYNIRSIDLSSNKISQSYNANDYLLVQFPPYIKIN